MDDRALLEYYEKLVDTFATPGWKLIIEKVKDIRVPLADIANCKDKDDYLVRKGRVAEIDYWLSFEGMHRDAYKELSDAQNV